MKEELYSWIRCLAIFYILLTMLLHLVPTEKYQRYVRFFMGLVLIVILVTSVLSILEKTRELPGSFSLIYSQEENKRLEQDMENLQKNLLEKGYEELLGENIRKDLQKKGIETIKCEVHIEGETLKAVLWTKEAPDTELERGIKDELKGEWGISEANCEIISWQNGEQAVGDPSPSGTASDGNSTSG